MAAGLAPGVWAPERAQLQGLMLVQVPEVSLISTYRHLLTGQS